ncbi:MAG: PAS domain S-box protein [Verrucomicrobiia bacterium]
MRWHHLYFLLVAIDVFAISLGLFLNHQLVETNKRTVQEYLQWVSWAKQCDALAQQASRVHVQGSDVLTAHDVPPESREMDAAHSVFNQRLSTLQRELAQNISPTNVSVLLKDCSSIHDLMDKLAGQVGHPIPLVNNGRRDQIQPQITRINRDYDNLLRAVDGLRSHLRAQRQAYLEGQIAEANAFQRDQWLLSLLIMAMVLGIAVYGVCLNRQMSASEIQIRNTQERYRSLVEQSTDGIMILDDDWNIRFANRPACRMFGYSYEEIVHLSGDDTYPPEHSDQTTRRRREINANGSARYERPALRKDGSRFLTEVIVRRLDQGGIQAIYRDITERKQVEEAHLRLAAIVESSHDAIVSTDLEGIITSWNAAAERLYGYTAHEIIGQSIAQIIPEDRRREKTDVLGRISTGEHVSQFESCCIAKDGRRFPVSLTVSPVKDASGTIVGTSTIIRDITERKRSEEQLRLQSAVLEAAANTIMITDSHGVVLWVNPAFTALTGYSPDEVIGKADGTLRSGEHDSEFYRELWETITAGRVWHGEMVNRRKDGSLYTEEMTITPVRDANGAISRFVAIKQDITRRKEAEQSLRETNTRLKHALEELQTAQQSVVQQERLRALGTMASGIAHDFNNALAAVVGFTELLLDRPEALEDKTRVRQYLQMMNTAAKDAGNVVNRLREFYRHRDRSEVFTTVDLNRLVQEAISLTQPKWKTQAEARGISIRTETDLQKVPPIQGNAADLREVLTNLIFNAVDAMPRGGAITLRTRSDDSRVILEIADSGTGMTQEIRQRCLEPFFTTKGEGGTGLGLSMVYGIIQRHEGSIDIQTQLHKGTTFILTLPVPGQPRSAVTDAPSAPAPLPSKRVLLVDDEEVVRKVVNEYLVRDGHTVEFAANGKDGLDKFHNGHFDLVILDRAMPDMSGDQVGAAIKNAFPNLPVIMLTGFGSMMEAADEKPAGIDFVVSKPVTLDTLRRAMARAVENN